MPQWIQLELPAARALTGCTITWESDRAYAHKVEGSPDGKAWTVLADALDGKKGGPSEHAFKAENTKFLRVTCTGTQPGQWVSIREVTLKGPGITGFAHIGIQLNTRLGKRF